MELFGNLLTKILKYFEYFMRKSIENFIFISGF